MNNVKKVLVELVLPLILAWFFMTVLVDIVTIPTVFRNSSNIVDAGKIGMKVFGTFNRFEIIFGLIVVAGSYFNLCLNCSGKWLYFAVPLSILSFIYTFYMTPMITNTTFEIHQTAVSSPLYAELQSKHAQYHNLYRTLDSSKLLVLLVFAGKVLFDRVKGKKECAV